MSMATRLLFLCVLSGISACGGDPSGPGDADTDTASDVDSFGALSVVSDPEGAQVYLDGSLIGQTPLLREDLVPGNYNIELTMNGYEPYSDTVTINQDHTTTIEIAMEPSAPAYDLRGRWSDGSEICDVTQSGNIVRGFCGVGSAGLILEGSTLSYNSSEGTITGEVIDNDHVTITINDSWGETTFSYTRL